jgi:nicotinamidase-related amidase
MSLMQESTTFINFVEAWLAARPALTLEEAIPNPEKSAIVSIDVINGFLYEGPLSSPRVAPIDRRITALMRAAWDVGLRDILLVQEGHQPGSLEFEAFGEHAIKGSKQAAATDLIQALPFYDQLTTIYKDSIHPALNNGFDAWWDERQEYDTFIAVGDVTDLCAYQLAMYLRLRANAFHKRHRVIVPTDCVQTWHLSVEDAKGGLAMPHHGDLLHAIFLYHMALNGIDVVGSIEV